MSYICHRCGYTNNLKTNFKRHLSRKLTCKPKIKEISINFIYNKYFKKDKNMINLIDDDVPQFPSISLNIPSISLNKPSISLNKPSISLTSCKYCLRSFKRIDNLKRHLQSCKFKNNYDKDMLINKKILEEKIQLEKELKQLLEEKEKDKEILKQEIIKQLANSGQLVKNKSSVS